MAERGIGAVLVMDGPALAGILSERDYARKVILAGLSSRETPVRQIMTGDVVTVDGERGIVTVGETAGEPDAALEPARRPGWVAPVAAAGAVVGAVAVVAAEEPLTAAKTAQPSTLTCSNPPGRRRVKGARPRNRSDDRRDR